MATVLKGLINADAATVATVVGEVINMLGLQQTTQIVLHSQNIIETLISNSPVNWSSYTRLEVKLHMVCCSPHTLMTQLTTVATIAASTLTLKLLITFNMN